MVALPELLAVVELARGQQARELKARGRRGGPRQDA
jgi:hypothetical protein